MFLEKFKFCGLGSNQEMNEEINLSKLRQEFITQINLQIKDSAYDDKHKDLIKYLYSDPEWYMKIDFNNLVNWEMHGDLGVPTNLRNELSKANFITASTKYLVKKISRFKKDKYFKQSILDDINIIKSLGGENLLVDNPVNRFPGNQNYWKTNKTYLNIRWLRYLYILNRFHKSTILNNGNTWVDIGSYYGGLQGLAVKYFQNCKYILVDFDHQLFRSFLYLNKLYPDYKHYVNPDINTDFNAPGFYYITTEKFTKYSLLKPDLVTNFFSFGEMLESDFNYYWESSQVNNSKLIYTVNRVKSGPFFEKTYNTTLSIINYLPKTNFKTIYFDIFPMHQYLITKKIIYGRSGFRNHSSDYFESLISR